MSDLEDRFIAEIKPARVRLSMTQEGLAREMEKRGVVVHQTAITKMERETGYDRRRLNYDEAVVISQILGIPLHGEDRHCEQCVRTARLLRATASNIDGAS